MTSPEAQAKEIEEIRERWKSGTEYVPHGFQCYRDVRMLIAALAASEQRGQDTSTLSPAGERRALLNLLAVIHRDGGHYAAKYGTEKASDDAEALVIATRDERDDLRAKLQAVREAGDFLWAVVANASGGDWKKETAEWQEAAARGRDEWFALARTREPESPRTEERT
jgi:hypothetical protein